MATSALTIVNCDFRKLCNAKINYEILAVAVFINNQKRIQNSVKCLRFVKTVE